MTESGMTESSSVAVPRRIRVLIVEDSPTVRQLLTHILSADPALQVIGSASDGEEAIEKVQQFQPDVITMDLHMPRMDGLEAVRIIMETVPTPIVIVSGHLAPADMQQTFLALATGALAVVEKPAGLLGGEAVALASKLVQTVKLMSEIKVVRRWPKRAAPPPLRLPVLENLSGPRADVRLIAIGASTGGPLVLHTILAGLAGNLSVPIVIVQHIAVGFIEGFADWLGKSSGVPVHVATDGEQMRAGHAYIAPDHLNMGIAPGLHIRLRAEDSENGHRPSVSYLFRSVAEVLGRHAVGALLSGMGRDGAAELKIMAERGAVTIAQDPETTVVAGMPGEAIKLGAALYILAPEKIVKMLKQLIAPAVAERS
jgi:two-component system, chemotaxis family, protein-glutamate methylesterase/glutaminase